MSLTEDILKEMLLENTGRMLTDSGGAYGRQWERNRQYGIKTGKQVCDKWADDNEVEIYPIIPIFDVFKAHLEYNDDCKMLEAQIESIFDVERLVKEPDNVFEEFDYWTGSNVAYTYNSDYNICSQDYQQCLFMYDNDDYICISIHNGCDARWGFTAPHIFKIADIDEFITANECAFVFCDCGYNDYRYSYDETYDYNEQNDLDNKILAKKTYIDEQGYLRCAECDSVIMCSAIDY